MVRAEALEWGQRLPKRLKRRGPHLIVASDVVGCGDEALYPPLIKTLVCVCVCVRARARVCVVCVCVCCVCARVKHKHIHTFFLSHRLT